MRRFPIRLRMQGAIGTVLALFALVGLAAWLGIHHLASLNQHFMVHSMAELHEVGDIRQALGRMRQAEKDMVIDFEDSAAVQRHAAVWQQALEGTRKGLNELQAGEEDEDNRLAREALTSLEAYATATQGVIRTLSAGSYDSARGPSRLMDRARGHVTEVEERVAGIAKVVDDEATETRAAFEARIHQVQVSFGLVMALVVVVVVPLTLLNSHSITEPLMAARDVAKAIAEGDLTRPIDTRGHDEVGQLMRALSTMQTALGGLVGEVRQAADSIRTASAEVASGNTDLSGRTEQAASSLQQTASSMEQLTTNVLQSAEAARHATGLADSASDAATAGGTVVHEVVQTMEDIQQSSRRIGDIIGTIDGIAFQTNILALNAAVEAARAGEQGRGFAVVAGEVRSLASRSAEAAREIKTLIGASLDRVEHGSRLVRDAGSRMEDIVNAVGRVSHTIHEISTATGEQSQGIGQVNQAVGQLDQMTQQNAALVEESAAAAESLREQATRLSSLVASYRVEGAAGLAASTGSAPVGRGAAPPPRPATRPAAPATHRATPAAAAPAARPQAPASTETEWETF
ncbi:HAMP domain-containing protein [Ideonella sp. TBM-1]|uniref:HAMP domain-containing protein n=2 Tax=Ideonella livida TaxID=2707176 RepID=A0A7C9TIU4_9BURK|nr:HAMP domain-containing protein [Ideonella livida]